MFKQFCVFLLLPALAMAGQTGSSGQSVPAIANLSRLLTEDPATACETAVAAAEVSKRLPFRLLEAISYTESGRIDPVTGRLHAWPWTVNAEGEGQFFATRPQAIDAVKALWARGVQSIDVGCMQINLLYHPRAFASLEQAFSPRANALYAAGFLTTLHAASQDWPHAIAAYHSDIPARGDAYRMAVLARWQMARWQNPGPASAKLLSPSVSEAAYRDFAPFHQVYGAFAPLGHTYGAFSPSR